MIGRSYFFMCIFKNSALLQILYLYLPVVNFLHEIAEPSHKCIIDEDHGDGWPVVLLLHLLDSSCHGFFLHIHIVEGNLLF